MSHSAELGIDADFSEVNLVEDANFNPEFLKLVSRGSLSIVHAFIDVVLSEFQCEPPHPYPRGEVIQEHCGSDRLSRVAILDEGRARDLYHPSSA
jgi:hypothetical protein